jgi:hypothetical protein
LVSDDTPVAGENAAQKAGINHPTVADDQAGIDHCITADFVVIANNRAEFPEAG